MISQNRWVGTFNAVSAFNNSGLSLLDANMVVFNQSAFIMISMGLFILAGNTGFPIFLRLFVWTLHKYLPDNAAWSDSKLTLKFLLDYPRRCYTNMFPSKHTWWLFGALVTLTMIDTTMFAILNVSKFTIRVDPN
jgi:Trk-type K+ transport system membrane component